MLLVIVGTMIVQARNASLWRWAATVADDEPAAPTESAAAGDEKVQFVETLVTGPNDQQPFEQSQAEYQFQAITDKAPMAAEEMPSYWRLARWSMTESFDDLWERAHKDRYFTHLGQTPEKHRGELIAMNISLRRVVRHPAETKQNAAGITQLYEATGVTDESRTGLYSILFYDLPLQLPVRPRIHEQVQFVGYFLKLFSYEDALGKTRWSPLLIGRLRLRENSANLALRRHASETRALPWLIGGAVLAFLGIVVWTRHYLAAGVVAVSGFEPASADHQAIENWLETGGAETASDSNSSDWEDDLEDASGSRPNSFPVIESPPTSGGVSPPSPP